MKARWVGVLAVVGACSTPGTNGGDGGGIDGGATDVALDVPTLGDASCDGPCNQVPAGLLDPDYTTTWNPGILADTATNAALGNDGLPFARRCVRASRCRAATRPPRFKPRSTDAKERTKSFRSRRERTRCPRRSPRRAASCCAAPAPTDRRP